MTIEKVEYNIFFDESTITSNEKNFKLDLMGSILFPKSLYMKRDIQNLTQRLRDGSLHLHFKDYRETKYRVYSDVLKTFLECTDSIGFNLVAFSELDYMQNNVAYGQGTMKNMRYAKIPERVIYGSVRNISKYKPTEVCLYIEEATAYKNIEVVSGHRVNLSELLRTQLNSQALYRNDSFNIKRAGLYSKNKEIGIEFTDMMIGICGMIIKNPSIYKDDGSINKTVKDKKILIYEHKNILKNIFSKMTYFELNGLQRLTKRDFTVFFHEFIHKYELEKENDPAV